MRRILLTVKLVILLLLLAVIFVAVALLPNIYFSKSDNAIHFLGATPPTLTADSYQVYIAGAVVNPGVYRLLPGERVGDVLQRAGGLLPEADQSYAQSQLNLAQILKDGDKVFIPFTGQTSDSQSKNSDMINLNTASVVELMSLPGVGESTANKIIQARPFTTIEQLLDVLGIGESKYAQLQNRVRI